MKVPKAQGWVAKLPEGFGWQEDGTFRLPLVDPVEHGSEKIAELTIRRPTVKDMRTVPVKLQNHDAIFNLLARLCAQPSVVLDKCGPDDTPRLIEIGAFFMDGSVDQIGAPS